MKKKKKSNVIIAEDMQKRIHRMALRTWDYIGPDTLRALEEAGESADLPKNDVLELVADADYMLTGGGDKEAYKVWDSLPTYEDKLAAIEGAFTFPRYGW